MCSRDEENRGKSDGAEYLPMPRLKRRATHRGRIRNTHLRILDQTATRPTLTQPAAQSILQNELVAARIFSSSDRIWITNNCAQPRVLDLSASATTRRTFCADAAVCNSHHRRRRRYDCSRSIFSYSSYGPEMLTDLQTQALALSTSRSTLAPTAATLALASESVRSSDSIPLPLPPINTHPTLPLRPPNNRPTLSDTPAPRTRNTTHPPLIHENTHLT
jgi:hypothetical protein